MICALPSVIAELVVGAVMTSPSSTMANSFRGAVSETRRLVTASKSFEPVPLKVMLTAYWPVLLPCELSRCRSWRR